MRGRIGQVDYDFSAPCLEERRKGREEGRKEEDKAKHHTSTPWGKGKRCGDAEVPFSCCSKPRTTTILFFLLCLPSGFGASFLPSFLFLPVAGP